MMQTLDPITLEVLWNRLLSVVNEQQVTLMRTAFSTVVRESQDLACGVFDTRGSMIAQSLTGPVALSISLIALMVAGGTLVFGGELSEFARRSCVAALAIAFLVLGAGFMTTLFGVGGATVL